MNESFLHYIWQYQYFDKSALCTTDGEPITVFSPGYRNTHAGPDFFNAKIRIGAIEWIGNVEIHIQSSGWSDHHHDTDTAYENVILHVVWDENCKIRRRDQTLLPTLALKHRIDESLVLQYRKLINDPGKIPCASLLNKVRELTRLSMLDKALVQRLEAKTIQVFSILKRNHNDWEDTTYQMLCRNFGFKVNAEPFEQLAQSLPYHVLLKHADQPTQVEALLFGQAGFLEERLEDDYFLLLKREYAVLGKKYTLINGQLNKAQWRFLRLRPANFPTLRLAQLAALLCEKKNIFSLILEAHSYTALRQLFTITQSAYWQHHYHFSKTTGETIPSIGTMSIDNILINTVVPLLFAYGRSKDDQVLTDRVMDILQHIPSEENAIIKNWQTLGVKSRSAFDSQALIELHNNFCVKRKCLDCNIGFSLIQPAVA